MRRPLFAAVALSLAVAVGTLPELSEAKRLGGGKNVGMQRQAPAQTPPQTPAQAPAPAAPAAPVAGKPAVPATAAAAAAAPAKRSWLGPIAGLAAGLGLAALFSALGFGEGFATFVMLLLLGLVAFVVIRLVLSRLRGTGGQPALAGAGAGAAGGAPASWPAPAADTAIARQSLPEAVPASSAGASGPADAGPAQAHEVSVTGAPLRPIQIGEALASPSMAGTGADALQLPDGFDLPAFERVAKMIFIRLQAANDSGDLDDLREFTTPEVFAALRLDIQERGGSTQQTDVERVDAQLVGFVQEPARQIASVRFTGGMREERDGPSTSFDEIWHLVKPQDASRSWAIAGIQQAQ